MKYDPTDPTGPTATASCCPAGTRRSCCTRCSTSRATASSSTTSKQFRQWGSRTPGHPEASTTPGRRGHHRSARPGLRQRRRHGHRRALPAGALRPRGRRPPHVRHLQRRLTSGGHQPRGRVARRPLRPRPARLRLRRQPHHDRRPDRARPTATTPASASRPTAGTSSSSARSRTTSTRLEEASGAAMAEEDRPSHRSSCAATSATRRRSNTDTARRARQPARRRRGRARPRRSSALPGRGLLLPDDVLDWYRGAGLRPAAAPRGVGRARSPNGRATAPSSTRASRAAASPGWEAKLPDVQRRREGRDPSGVLERASTRSLDVVPGVDRRRRRPHREHRHRAEGRAASVAPTSPVGRQIHFGIREHGMGGVMDGMARHGGVLPVGGTFFVFSDYMRGAVRLAALSKSKCVFVWTHDSVGLGEDGPTHQPIEQLASLRAMPELRVIRPADANETAQAWRIARRRDGPDRADPHAARTSRCSRAPADGEVERGRVRARRGAPPAPDLVLVGTGSEVSVCVEAAATLTADGVAVRVVSMPSWELFAAQPTSVPRGGAAAGGATRCRSRPARRSAGSATPTTSVGIDRFGASAPGSGRPRQVSASTPRTWSSRPERCSEGSSVMNRSARDSSTSRARAPGSTTSSGATSRAASSRTLVERRHPRAHVEPDDLPEGDLRSADYDEQFKELAVDDQPVHRRLLGPRHPRHQRRPRRVRAGVRRRATVATASCRSRWRPTSRATPTGTIESGAIPARADQPAEPVREDPGHRRGRPGDPADDQRGPQHQRHVDLLPRPLRRGHRGVPLRPRGLRRATSPASRAWRRSSSAGSTPRSTAGSTRSAPRRARPARQGCGRPGQARVRAVQREVLRSRWEALGRPRRQVQRPLWASTSTKNPAYPDTLYVDELIGPDTVNTMPDQTIEAFEDHGTVARTVDVGVDQARRDWEALAALRHRRRRRGPGPRGRGPVELRQVLRRAPHHAPGESRRDRRGRCDATRPIACAHDGRTCSISRCQTSWHGPADPRRGARHPGHLLAEGVHPADDAVPRPVRLLHLRPAAGPARVALPHARRGARDRPRGRRARAATRRCSPSASAPRTATPSRAEWLAAHGYASTVDYLVADGAARARRDRPAPPRQRRRAVRRRARPRCGRSRRRRG